MRSFVLVCAVAAASVGCGDDAAAIDHGNGEAPFAHGRTTPSPSGTNPAPDGGTSEAGKAAEKPPAPTEEAEPQIDPSPTTHPEVVYVLARGATGTGFCTGTLVARDVVVTAAHCFKSIYSSWTVVAPNAPNRPRVAASWSRMYDPNWDEPSSPDLGILALSRPIDLPAYAVLTDVSVRVDGGQKTLVNAVVRTDVKPEAPLEKTDPTPLSSTVEYGYEQGFGVPLFSKGGDSGAGMFLIEGGKMTHKLVAVIREPEPDRDIDHLSRVSRAFIEWVGDNRP
jgi:hypothetical protein